MATSREQAILSLIETRAEAHPAAMEVELGYQARIGCDRSLDARMRGQPRP